MSLRTNRCINETLKKFTLKIIIPVPGIEPGPPGWKPGILTTRPHRNYVSALQITRYPYAVKSAGKFTCTYLHLDQIIKQRQQVVVAELLRRWTRNPLGSSRAGSNPADNAIILMFEFWFKASQSTIFSHDGTFFWIAPVLNSEDKFLAQRLSTIPTARFEPGTSWLWIIKLASSFLI